MFSLNRIVAALPNISPRCLGQYYVIWRAAYSFSYLCSQLTREAASARPARPKKRGIRPTTTAVVPVRFAASITCCVTGIAAATIRIVPKMTFMIGFPLPFFCSKILYIVFYAPDCFLFCWSKYLNKILLPIKKNLNTIIYLEYTNE